jgi:hypothetical protein
MSEMMRALLTLTLIALALGACFAEREEFVLPQQTQTRMWRLTNDSSWRDWANYHIRNCWSPDGRYVCTVRHRQFDMWQDGGIRVRVIDVATGEVIRTFDRANTPRWAHRHNWLFFVQMPEEGGTWNIMWWDLDTDRLTQLQGRIQRVLELEKIVDHLTEEGRNEHLERARHGECLMLPGVLYLDALMNYEKIGDHVRNIGRALAGGLMDAGTTMPYTAEGEAAAAEDA